MLNTPSFMCARNYLFIYLFIFIFLKYYPMLHLSFSFSCSNILWFVSHMFHFIWLNTVSFFPSPQDQLAVEQPT